MLKKQIVQIEVVYNDDGRTDPPIDWTWRIGMDLGPDESIEVIGGTYPQEVTP